LSTSKYVAEKAIIGAQRYSFPQAILLGFMVFASSATAAEQCRESNGLIFMRIPAGEFTMGANVVGGKEVGYRDERPRHQVSIKSVCMMRESLTADQAKALRSEYGIAAADSDEIELFTWREAKTLADRLSKKIGKTVRLPTEAEWEYAARGGLANKEFPWGDLDEVYEGKAVRDLVLQARQECRLYSVDAMIKDQLMRSCIPKDASDYTILNEFKCVTKAINDRVPTPLPNRFGLMEVVNNDWEWTSSRYMPYPYKPGDGRESPPTAKKDFRVVRGGNNNTESCKGYTSLRGYGSLNPEYESTYSVRYVLEE
jgi:formylglycine-generating enzyme required for sulfatase activity